MELDRRKVSWIENGYIEFEDGKHLLKEHSRYQFMVYSVLWYMKDCFVSFLFNHSIKKEEGRAV